MEYIVQNYKLGGWKLTQNEAFNRVVKKIAEFEADFAGSDDLFFEDEDMRIILGHIDKIKRKLNRISKFVDR